jgi:aspartate beta-hydroxylase
MITDLLARATEALKAGRSSEAEVRWREVLARQPLEPRALYALGSLALHRHDVKEAVACLLTAHRAAPRDLAICLALMEAHRADGQWEAERSLIDVALAVDPYFIPALLAKADWFERHRSRAAAAATYANVLKIAPPEAQWPLEFKSQLLHARSFANAYANELEQKLLASLAERRTSLPASLAERWREAVAIHAGTSAPFVSRSNQLAVPRLPAIPFYPREQFTWAADLEEQTPEIRDELSNLLRTDREKFDPYIQYRPGDPVNQWRELNHSLRWSAFHLWRNGAPVDAHLTRCPQTARALERVALARLQGLCPNAMFSVLAPHTHIPPHHGETNARVVVHLPLIVPPGCRYRVGYEWREWRVGEILVFDDTIEHEAFNDSDEWRVVLLFDVWNPLLQDAERAVVRALAAAAREFSGIATQDDVSN